MSLLAISIGQIINVVPGSVGDGLIWSILTIGVFLSFRILNFADMSVEGTFALGGTVTASLIFYHSVPVGLAMIIGVICGFVAGVVTGVLHTKLKIPAILSGIITMFVLYSVNIHVLGNKASLSLLKVDTLVTFMKSRGLDNVGAKLLLSLIFALASSCVIYWFFGTKFGSTVRATGCNPNMSRAQGINTDLRIVITLGISNALAALAGSILVQTNSVVTSNMGSGAIVIGLAGVVLGEAVVSDRFPFWAKLIGIVSGSVLYRIIIAVALQLLDGFLTTDDMKLISAVIIVIVLAAKYFSSKRAKKSIANTTGVKGNA